MTVNRNSKCLALHARQMFADIVAKLRIQRERSRVKTSLNEPYAGEIFFRGPLVHGIHQTPANGAILYGRIDRNWANTCNAVAFIEKIAADNPSIDFRNYGIKVRISHHSR